MSVQSVTLCAWIAQQGGYLLQWRYLCWVCRWSDSDLNLVSLGGLENEYKLAPPKASILSCPGERNVAFAVIWWNQTNHAKKFKRLKLSYSCLWETHYRATERHLPYGITPATRHRWTCAAFTLAWQAGTGLTYPGGHKLAQPKTFGKGMLRCYEVIARSRIACAGCEFYCQRS